MLRIIVVFTLFVFPFSLFSQEFNTEPHLEDYAFEVFTGITDDTFVSSANVGDINNDGIDDLAVVFYENLLVYFGGSIESQTPLTFSVSSPYRIIGIAKINANDDDIDDFVISVFNFENPSDQELLIFYGNSTLNDLFVSNKIESSSTELYSVNGFVSGLNIANCGDINNDNFDDLITSTPAGENVIVYLGGPGFGIDPFVIPIGRVGFAPRLFALNDVNGDGIDDIAVSKIFNRIVYIYFGGNNKIVFDSPDITIDFTFAEGFNEGQQYFGLTLATADGNNDGNFDLFIRSSGSDSNGNHAPSLFFIPGGPAIQNKIEKSFYIPVSTWKQADGNTRSVHDFKNIGDFDGDQVDDFLLGSWDKTVDPNAYTFSSNISSEVDLPRSILDSPDDQLQFGEDQNNGFYQHINAAGDFNNNGKMEIVLGQPVESGYTLYFYESTLAPVVATEKEIANNTPIYPNPTSGILQIKSMNTDVGQIELYSSSGQLLITVPKLKTNTEIDLNKYSNGKYTLKLRSEGGREIESRKIILIKSTPS